MRLLFNIIWLHVDVFKSISIKIIQEEIFLKKTATTDYNKNYILKIISASFL